MKAVVVVLVAALCALALAHDRVPQPLSPEGVLPCYTQQMFERRYGTTGLGGNVTLKNHAARAGLCFGYGECDDPSFRARANEDMKTISVTFHIMAAANGSYPDGVDGSVVTASMNQLIMDFQPYGITFKLEAVQVHKNSEFYCIPKYTDKSDAWIEAVDDMKQKYSVTPEETINIFVSCQDSGTEGTLLGFGTFPWDETWSTWQGGIWMHGIAMGHGYRTLTHEMGHNLGLWHIFHGVSEMRSCNDACFEHVHAYDAEEADYVGDFCADTMATPINYECADPSGRDCYSKSWGNTDYTNFMAYSGDKCMNHFTDNQRQRAHCWTCESLSSLMVSGSC